LRKPVEPYHGIPLRLPIWRALTGRSAIFALLASDNDRVFMAAAQLQGDQSSDRAYLAMSGITLRQNPTTHAGLEATMFRLHVAKCLTGPKLMPARALGARTITEEDA